MADVLKPPIIIIGGGLVGLTLAQALKKAGIECTVYEQNTAQEAKSGGGWAITIHWALGALEECLPPELFRRLDEIQVDPEQGADDHRRFLFLNLATGLPKYEISPSIRKRVNRRLLRNLLAEGLNIQYGRRINSFEVRYNRTVTARFEDGTLVSGKMLIACDGTNSVVRKMLFSTQPEAAELYQLPVRAMGATIQMSKEQVQPLRQIDPLLFQGCHPDTGVFLWYSIVSTPALNGSQKIGEPYFEGQLFMSWLRISSADEVPTENTQKLRKMQNKAQGFHPCLKTLIESIPSGTDIKEVRLQDWPSRSWPTKSGLITLAGDSAHPMTMYRGEAFNHGVTDAAVLVRQITEVERGNLGLADAMERYGAEVVARTHDAVLLSRQACLDAHNYHGLHSESPLVSKRSRVLVPAIDTSVRATDCCCSASTPQSKLQQSIEAQKV